MPFPVERFGGGVPLRRHGRSKVTQGSATRGEVALLDRFAPLAKTAEPKPPTGGFMGRLSPVRAVWSARRPEARPR
jgi:hypothetical protein